MAFLRDVGNFIHFYTMKFGVISPHRAAEYGDQYAVQQYLKLGYRINAINKKYDETMLMVAAEQNNPTLVQFLFR
ncbi:ankyrin repeat domain-containing protein [Parashewanella tropica]|uniref:ankyrin repeat domain-containing protein n=1 Tax=Parashewanella tropica TaxID=2547970 RepID=UPI0010598206|nr:ankyrin repeat domain-containing protein [Parashewanella tropica]